MTQITDLKSDHGASQPPAPRKFNRYTMVTVVGAPTNFLLYLALFARTPMSALAANLVAATIIAPATYLAYRRWVWPEPPPGAHRREIGPYWMMTMISVLAATMAVGALQSASAPAWILSVTPLAAYTVLWLARFAFLDRVLFSGR